MSDFNNIFNNLSLNDKLKVSHIINRDITAIIDALNKYPCETDITLIEFPIIDNFDNIDIIGYKWVQNNGFQKIKNDTNCNDDKILLYLNYYLDCLETIMPL